MTSLRANPCLQAIGGVLDAHGIPYSVEYGGKHPRVVIPHPGGTHRIGFSGSTDDAYFAAKKAAAQARREVRALFPEKFDPQENTVSHQSLRGNAVYKVAVAELEAAGIPFTVSTGRKHPALLFDIHGRRAVFSMPNRPFEGRAIDKYRGQIRQMIRGEAQGAVEDLIDLEGDDFSVIAPPTLTTADLVLMADVPRIRDLDLATKLGFTRPTNIRKLIDRNDRELQAISPLLHDGANSQSKLCIEAKRERGEAYWLDEAQAVLVIMKSDTPMAEAMRAAITAVFIAWREERGIQSLATPIEEPASLPAPDIEIEAALPAPIAAPRPPALQPQLLADETAIDLITDMVGFKMEAILGPAIDRALDRLVAEHLSAAIERSLKPLLSQQMRWGTKQRDKLLSAIAPRLDDVAGHLASQALSLGIVEAALDRGVSEIKGSVDAARRQTLAVAGRAAKPAPSPTAAPPPPSAQAPHPWDLDDVREALTSSDPFPPASAPTPATSARPLQASTLPASISGERASQDLACLLDVYVWSGINVPAFRRRSIGQKLKASMQKRFPGQAQLRIIPWMKKAYSHYPKDDLRRWFDEEGERLIREFVYPQQKMAAE